MRTIACSCATIRIAPVWLPQTDQVITDVRPGVSSLRRGVYGPRRAILRPPSITWLACAWRNQWGEVIVGVLVGILAICTAATEGGSLRAKF
jgi:hypothetical protein